MSSRRNWLIGSASCVLLGCGALSLPGGGPRSLLAGTPARTNFAAFGSKFTVGELRNELTWLVDTMLEVGAKPFAAATEATFQDAYAGALRQLDHEMDARGLFLVAAPLFARLNDAHVSVRLGYDFETWLERGGVAFPLSLTFDADGMFVDVTTAGDVPSGTKIVDIDGIDAATVMSEIIALHGAQSPTMRRIVAVDFVRQYYYARYGERDAFTVRALRPDGTMVHTSVPASSAAQYRRTLNAAAQSGDYTFERIEGGIGLSTIAGAGTSRDSNRSWPRHLRPFGKSRFLESSSTSGTMPAATRS